MLGNHSVMLIFVVDNSTGMYMSLTLSQGEICMSILTYFLAGEWNEEEEKNLTTSVRKYIKYTFYVTPFLSPYTSMEGPMDQGKVKENEGWPYLKLDILVIVVIFFLNIDVWRSIMVAKLQKYLNCIISVNIVLICHWYVT